MLIKIFTSADNAGISLDEFNWLSSVENWVGAFSFFAGEIFMMVALLRMLKYGLRKENCIFGLLLYECA